MDTLTAIAQYVDRTPEEYFSLILGDITIAETFRPLSQARRAMNAVLAVPSTVASFPRLALVEDPDGFTQFVMPDAYGNLEVHRDTTDARQWLARLLGKVESDFVSYKESDFEGQEDVNPSVIFRSILNSRGGVCAYLVAPVEIRLWDSNRAAEGLDIGEMAFRPGDLGEPFEFIKALTTDGRFQLPAELARFTPSQLAAFWVLYALVADAGVPLDRVLAGVPHVLEGPARAEANRAEEREFIPPRYEHAFGYDPLPELPRRMPIAEQKPTLDTTTERIAIVAAIAYSALVVTLTLRRL